MTVVEGSSPFDGWKQFGPGRTKLWDAGEGFLEWSGRVGIVARALC